MGKAAKRAPFKRVRRKREIAEEEILAAASDLLREGEFRSLSVEEVMEHTAMQRPTFYNYFADRNELVMRLLGRIETQMMDASQPWLDAGGPALLADALDGVVAVYADHGHVLRAAHEASFHDAAVEQYYRHTLLQNFMDGVARRLRAEKRAGNVNVPNPDALAHALLLLNASMLAERLGQPTPDQPRAVAATIKFIWARTIYKRDDLTTVPTG